MFNIIHDLSSLDENQRKQYLRDYSQYLGLNPDENRLDMIWMNTESVRTLVAYCRRGTTDLLRDIWRIDVVSLEKEDGPGYVSYKATGVNIRGRKEIAVGAYATAGLTGDRLAAAVATAQTRALQRLTLIFVGGGLLDQSEVTNQTVTSDNITLPLMAVPALPPEVTLNTEAGKLVETKTEYHVDKLPATLPKHSGETLVLKPEAVEAVNAILEAEPATKPMRKKRRSKNTVDLGDQPVEIPVETVAVEPVKIETPVKPVSELTVPVCPECNQLMTANSFDMYVCLPHGRVDANIKPSMILAQQALKPVAVPTAIPVIEVKKDSPVTPEEQKIIKSRLSVFWVHILPEQGKMTADDGISINGKLTKFANSFFPDAPDSKKWAYGRWKTFLDFIEDYNKNYGAVDLVKHINEKIK